MIEIKDKKDCNGCQACGDICPRHCISFQVDNEGFWYPTVDKEACINCGLCERVCPQINIGELKKKNQSKPRVFGCYNKNIVIRFDSTSGGIFSALANRMYKDGGYVGGAVFNEDWSVSNYISDNKKDLPRLRSSKYVQSNAEGLYKKIRRLLNDGNKVLVCGSPCQMAALRTYLGKDYENLIIVDFLCRATNSPKAYRKYLDWLEAKYESKIIYIKAKNKDHGWRSLARKVVFENGEIYYGEGYDDPYRRGYHRNCYERPSCYDCKFKGLPRISDITLADFWGIEKVDPSMDKNLGTSLVFCNTEKGLNFFEKIKGKLECKEYALDQILPYNNDAIFGGIRIPNIDRKEMFSEMDRLPFDRIAEKYFPIREVPVSKMVKIKRLVRQSLNLASHPCIFIRSLRYNKIVDIMRNRYFKVLSHSAIDIAPTGRILVSGGQLIFGLKRNKKSKEETALLIEDGGTLQIDGSNFIKTTSDIQIFRGALLRFGPGATNMGLKIVCSEKIWIGDNTRIGRDVWIRDNNGGHTVIQAGYKDTAPVIIGDNVWICSNVSIMKGVTIGDGAIISANSVVTSNVPAHSIVSGNPATVIAENIVWRP